MTVERLQKGIGVVFGRGKQRVGQCSRHLAANAGLNQRVQQDEAAEVPADMAGTKKARKQLFQPGQVHFVFSSAGLVTTGPRTTSILRPSRIRFRQHQERSSAAWN